MSEEEYENEENEYSESEKEATNVDDDNESLDQESEFSSSIDDDDDDEEEEEEEDDSEEEEDEYDDDSTHSDAYDSDSAELSGSFEDELHDRLILNEEAENFNFSNEDISPLSSRSTKKKTKNDQSANKEQTTPSSTREGPSYPFNFLPVSYSENADTIDYLGFSSQLMDVKNQSLDLDELLK